ncbi:hypothetical protein Q6251_29895, partial [Klebsiella quasipneumoniae]|nr:hypothetical protein [Klebsiella quasipneumoniae]
VLGTGAHHVHGGGGFVFVPGTVLLFAIAALAGSGALSLSETLLLGFLGGLLGDGVSYYLGRHFLPGFARCIRGSHWFR